MRAGEATCPGLLCQASGEPVAAAALAAWGVVGETLDTLDPDQCDQFYDLERPVTCACACHDAQELLSSLAVKPVN